MKKKRKISLSMIKIEKSQVDKNKEIEKIDIEMQIFNFAYNNHCYYYSTFSRSSNNFLNLSSI